MFVPPDSIRRTYRSSHYIFLRKAIMAKIQDNMVISDEDREKIERLFPKTQSNNTK